MGIQIMPVLEDGTSLEVAQWKTLAQSFDALGKLAAELNVVPLIKFDSTLPEDIAQDDELEEICVQILEHDGVLPTRQWFEPDEASRTTATLLFYLRSHVDGRWSENSDDRNSQDAVIEVLEGLQRALQIAMRRGVRFYLRVCL